MSQVMYSPGRPLIPKSEFIRDMKSAIDENRGYAVGKIGISERHWLYYPILLERESDKRKIKAYEVSLCFRSLMKAGLFPAKPEFYLRYNDLYSQQIKTLDCLGICGNSPTMEAEVIRYYGLDSKLIHYVDQEPDRSTPDDPSNCYLPHFRGKKLLLVSPFARLLKERATRETFEAVWSKTGKPWFYPQSVDFLEFPYGYSSETQNQYATALDLLKSITDQIESRDFDIALIGAGGLGIPLAAFIKSRGKVGISLGGHIQVLFGVQGERWRNQSSWQEKYFNAAWIDMPRQYHPKPDETTAHYW